jgi:VanZ family protein
VSKKRLTPGGGVRRHSAITANRRSETRYQTRHWGITETGERRLQGDEFSATRTTGFARAVWSKRPFRWLGLAGLLWRPDTPALSQSFILKLVAWLCLAALGLLSLLPGSYVKRTGFGGHLEHFFGYLLTAGIFCLAYRSRRHALLIAVGLTAVAALFETAQYVSPGRTPALSAWAAGTAGVVTSGLLGWLVARLLPSRAP